MIEIQVKRGQVYYTEFDFGIGCEQQGKRPCVIIQNDIGNYNSCTTIVAPMTTQRKKDLPTHVKVS